MAAERVFYGENSTGVGGDVQSATARSAWMVGACAMAPERIEFADGFKPPKGKTEDEVREEIAKKYQRIGDQIMNRSGGGCTATRWAVSWAIRRNARWPRSSSGRHTSPRTS